MKFIKPHSLTLRLTVLFAVVSSAVLLSLGLVVGKLLSRHFQLMDNDLLLGKLELITQVLRDSSQDSNQGEIVKLLNVAMIGHPGLSIQIRNSAGALVYHLIPDELPLAELKTPIPETAEPTVIGKIYNAKGQALWAVTSTVQIGHVKHVVELATNLAVHERFMRSFMRGFWITIALAGCLSGFLGWIVARRGLAPLRTIQDKVRSIQASNLQQRLPDGAMPRELAAVTRTFNEMLARLEESFRRLSDFSSDLAHELRTPLSNLLTQTQVTLGKSRPAAEYEDILASNAEELERLSAMIADMLFLAKADHRTMIPNRKTVHLHQEAASLKEFYGLIADEKEIQIQIEGCASVQGDALMLRRALANLLSNALRYTPAQGLIAFQLKSDETWARCTISNTGKRIATEHLPRLFDRFYRVDSSRSTNRDENGLGLAITRSIVEAHDGKIWAESSDDSTRFILELPSDGTTG